MLVSPYSLICHHSLDRTQRGLTFAFVDFVNVTLFSKRFSLGSVYAQPETWWRWSWVYSNVTHPQVDGRRETRQNWDCEFWRTEITKISLITHRHDSAWLMSDAWKITNIMSLVIGRHVEGRSPWVPFASIEKHRQLTRGSGKPCLICKEWASRR